MDLRVLTADGREQIKQELEKVGQGIGEFALKALLGNEVYKNTEIIIENLKRIKETDPQRYNEIVRAINEYNKEQEALKGSFIPAAVLPIAPAVLEFLVEIGAVSVALGGTYGAKKIGDKFVENSSEYDFLYNATKDISNQQNNKDNIYNYEAPPKDIKDVFPNAENSSNKNQRKRWVDGVNGDIYEWDYQHGDIEIYDKRGKHKRFYKSKNKKAKTTCERKENKCLKQNIVVQK